MAKIMVVDDAAFMRMVLKNILTEGGHEIIAEAINGEDAVHHYLKCTPDLVTMDITMPEMDGIAALKELIKINPLVKVVMCSAMGQQGMVLEAIYSGAKDFVVKPFQKERVLESVMKALA
ncbi:response regulator [Cohnella endophytica]|uniref:Response regulator n=1 Tax=Cohnella endophytica TaxID=2419778 RepID=A0A494XWQ0_9BACL|nr:response regulator [Cohnella endophytica]RKP54114.1 response regulator [Cohnella endophytica]